MKKNKTLLISAIVIISLLAVGGFGYFFLFRGEGNSLVTVKLYNSQGQLLNSAVAQEVVNGVEGIAFVSFDLNIKNLDTVPLTFRVTSLTPSSVANFRPTQNLTLAPNANGKLSTALVPIAQFVNSTQDFCFTIVNDPISSLRDSKTVNACATLSILANPSGNFDVDVNTGLNNTGVNPSCTVNWQCDVWGTCTNNIQTRTCTDLNICGTQNNMPSTQQVCQSAQVPLFETNAVSGNYNVVGVWIKVNGRQYNRQGTSAYNCVTTDIILTTPQGYPVCSRSGYDVNQRVYLRQGTNGIIFEF